MMQADSSQGTDHKRVPFHVIQDARKGDTEAMMLARRHFEPYIRTLATDSNVEPSYFNPELYERLITRLILISH